MKPIQHPARGAILLLALLLTALVVGLVSSALWHQSGQIQIESAERQRQQGQWLLNGATDWARLILREDAITSKEADHLSEPWAVPLQESRLSTFLSAQPGLAESSIDTRLADQVWLSGSITDAQGKFNLTNLYPNNAVDPNAVAQLTRLFELLGLGDAQALTLIERWSRTRGNSPRLLAPRSLDDFMAWGLSPESIERLRAHLTILPDVSKLNVNTASPEVLAATFETLGLAQAERLVQNRLRAPWTNEKKAQSAIPAFNTQQHSIQSDFFEVRGRLRMDSITLAQTALVKRTGNEVIYVWVLAQSPTLRP